MDPITALFIDEESSADYAKYRPYYCEDLFKDIVDYCKETGLDLDVAVDVGCGPGNSTLGFTPYFKKVIGVDISPTQIEAAPKDRPNCDFRVGYSHQLTFLDNESVDLFASGLAFYLMPQKETFAEADRVLKPGGTVAIFGYSLPRCTHPVMDEILQQSFKSPISRLPQEYKDVVNKMDKTEIPYPGWERRKGPTLISRFNLEGFWAQWRIVQSSLLKIGPPEEKDKRYTQEIQAQLDQKMPNLDPTREFDVQWDTYVMLGHKPSK